MVRIDSSFTTRLVIGVVIGSILAATWFHLSGFLMSSNGPGDQQLNGAPELFKLLLKHVSLVAFQSVVALVIFVCIGLPVYFVARRLGADNLRTAIASGFVVGLLVSMLYGGPEFNSLVGLLTTFVNFGTSGMIGACALWYYMRGQTCKREQA